MSHNKRLGVGVISLGWMGRLHARAYRNLREFFPELAVDIDLVCAADRSDKARDDAVGFLGFSECTDNYLNVINNPDIDVVSICSPNYLHHEMALAAIEAKKPFWIEKPLALTLEQSTEIVYKAREAGLINAIGFNYRHAPAIEKARQLINNGELGKVTNIRCWLLADYAGSEQSPLTWRFGRSHGGNGVLGDLLTHGVDMVQYLAGNVEKVSATTGVFIKDRPIPASEDAGHFSTEISDQRGAVENEDYVAVIAQLAGGAIATLESSRVSVGPRAEYVIEVYGTKGSLRWNFEHMNDLLVYTNNSDHEGYSRVMAGPSFPDFSRFQPGAGTSMGFDDLKTIQAGLFIKSVLSGEQLAPSVFDGLSADIVNEQVLRATEKQTWVNVPTVESVLGNHHITDS